MCKSVNIDETYKSLGYAIIKFAVDDYVQQHKKKAKTTNQETLKNIDWEIKRLDKFFRSDWCLSLLPDDIENTEGFIYHLNKMVEKELEKAKAKVKFKPDEKTIVRLYVEELKSTHQIAELCGISDSTVRNRLHKAGVKLRGKERPADVLTKELLEDLYWNKEKTSRDIGFMYGLSEFTVLAKMKEHGVPVRRKGRRKLY